MMRLGAKYRWLVACALAGLLAIVVAVSCSPDTNIPPGPAELPVSHAIAKTSIGAEGGTVTPPTGAQIVVPPGALTAAVDISLEGIDAPTTAELGSAAVGQAFRFGPSGQQFLK